MLGTTQSAVCDGRVARIREMLGVRVRLAGMPWLVSPARHGEERVWSNSHHHLVSNTPRNSWRVN